MSPVFGSPSKTDRINEGNFFVKAEMIYLWPVNTSLCYTFVTTLSNFTFNKLCIKELEVVAERSKALSQIQVEGMP